MKETIEFRIPEPNAAKYLPKDVGKRLSDIVRKVVVSTDAPLFDEIGRLQRKFRTRGKYFFHGREFRRTYSRREIEAAELFHVWPRRVFEPAGEECGTQYDEASACGHVFAPAAPFTVSGHTVPGSASTCGVGARQLTPLFLDGRRIPRKTDFACTIADEIVASARVAGVFQEEGLTGAAFDPIRLRDKGGRTSESHFQMKVIGPPVELDPTTRAGDGPFDDDASGQCPFGHIVGLNLLSEVTVRRESMTDADIVSTKQMVGVRRGLLRPRPILLFSRRAWRAIEAAKLKGLSMEVAYLRPR